jgi:Tol biopolymer transport system component
MLAPGTRLGVYEIVAPIGAGGMGEVYKAKDTRLSRLVALKIVPAHVSGDPALRERFEREARTIGALNHPHICILYDVGSDADTNFLVLEYLEGQTLAERLTRGALPIDEALKIAIQIADALDEAHRSGVVHRDLKPGNIMLTKSGAKLLDFGLAKERPAAVEPSELSMVPTRTSPVTIQGMILGTLHYMAPEQVEGDATDARTDIFAFGSVLYEMVTGKKAFDGNSQASVIAGILERQPASLAAVTPIASPALAHIVTRCLAKDPRERWQTTSDLRRELQWVEQAGPVVGVAGHNGMTRRTVRFAWTVAASSAALALAVGVASFFRGPPVIADVTRLDVETPPTSDTFSFAISPDGRQLAFVATSKDATLLWVRPFDQGAAQLLVGTEGAEFPFWSPDSRTIGFFADGKLKRIDSRGGRPQVIADAPTARGGAWSREGVIVVGQGAGGLTRVSASGGVLTEFTHVTAGQNNHRWPQFLPDGRVLFFATGEAKARGMYVTSIESSTPERVIDSENAVVYASPGYLLRVSEGTLAAYAFDLDTTRVIGDPISLAHGIGGDDGLYHAAISTSNAGVLAYRAGAGGRRQLVWLDRSGKVLGSPLEPDTSGTASPSLAPDDRQIVVQRTVQGNNDLWVVDERQGTTRRLTFSSATEAFPIWSPDGSRVVFTSLRNGFADIFEKPANGAAEETLLVTSREPKTPLDWTAARNLVLYASQSAKTQGDLWAVPATHNQKPFPVVQTPFDDVQGQFSPDGQWLAYASNESGRYEVYVRPFPDTGGRWQISNGGGAYPRWRHDGRELYYVSPGDRVMAVSIEPDTEARSMRWAVPMPIFAARFAAGVNIFSAGAQSRAQYSVSTDGRFLANMQVDDPVTPPITVVLNWQAALKQ